MAHERGTLSTNANDGIDAIETVYRAWYEAHASIPGVEVHSDRDVAWMLAPGVGWSNAAVHLRFSPKKVETRLDAILDRAAALGRGFGFWVSDLAEPDDLAKHLAKRKLRNRKRFPGMVRELRSKAIATRISADVDIRELDDHDLFLRHPHPYFGSMRSKIRRFELERMTRLAQLKPKVVFDLVAFEDDVPVGAATIFVPGATACLFDVGVLESHRNRGIGAAVVSAACDLAQRRGAKRAVLLSSGMGYSMYRRLGFVEAGRIAYWFRGKGA